MKHRAVLANEFGSVGLDGAIYSTKGTFVKEVPGGGMYCAVGIPMQVAVNRLLRQAKPDRWLIEPSGWDGIEQQLKPCVQA